MFLNTPFNKGDCILIKNLYVLKQYIAQKLLKEFQVRAATSEVFGGC